MASIRKIRMLLLYFLEINAMLGFCKSFPISFCTVPEKEGTGSEVYNRFMKWIFSKDTISIPSQTDRLEPRRSDFVLTKEMHEKDPLNTRRSDFTSMKTMPEKGETGDLEPRPSGFESNNVYVKAAKAEFPLPGEFVFSGLPEFAPHGVVPFGLPELPVPVRNRELQGGLPDVLNDQQRRIIRNLGGNLRDAADEWDERNSRSTEGQYRGSEIIRNMQSAFYQVLILPCFKILNLAFHVMEEFIEDWLHKEW